MPNFHGVYTALVTPFDNGEVDWGSLKKLIKFQIDNGIQGFVVSGTTAESPCLSEEEKHKLFNFVKAETAGQVPILVGTGTNNTAETIRLTKEAQKWGADGALVVVPYYNKPPQAGLLQHYLAVAQNTELPVMLYNVPSRTIASLSPETVIELSRVPNIVGIKEATGDVNTAQKILKGARPGFIVTSGDDASFLELMNVGAHGIISVGSHILPKQFVFWYERMKKGQTNARQDIAEYLGLISELYVEANPIPVKTALWLMGILKSPEMRLPLVRLDTVKTERLRIAMTEKGLL